MANELKAPGPGTATEVVRRIVTYLRKEASSFDKVIEEGEALAEDVRWAKVKRMSVNAMADRIERGDWEAE